MNIFETLDYKIYVRRRIEMMPSKGRGQYLKIAKHLDTGSVNISQIFKGERDLTLEQANELCDYFSFTELEAKYFLVLVAYARAGTAKLRARHRQEINELREKSQNLKDRLRQEGALSEEARAIFYSNWYYSGIRLSTSLSHQNSVEELAARFNLPVKKVREVLEFLVQVNLCKVENNKYKMGASSTHIEAQSPLVTKHHTNWRLKALTRMESYTDEELFFTMPCSLSRDAIEKIRVELVNMIEAAAQHVDAGPEEELACLSIDFFKF